MLKRVHDQIGNKAPRLGGKFHPRDLVLDVAMELAREIAREIDPAFSEGVDEVLGWFTPQAPADLPFTVTVVNGVTIVEGAGVLRVDGKGGGWDNDAHIASPLQTFKHYHPATDPNHEHRHWPRYERVGIRDYWKDPYSFWIPALGTVSAPGLGGGGKSLPHLPDARRRAASGFSPDNKWKARTGITIKLPPGGGPPTITSGVPKGRTPGERKHRGHKTAMAILGGALDISSEIAEYWQILRDLAGVPDSMTEREFFMYLYNGGIWDIDPNELAIAFSKNLLEDVFYGRFFGAVQRAMRDAGQSTYTMPSGPGVF
ncbi:hypothetical protein vBRpoMiV15_03 [Ruegeria phage vB_RpoMi-V15]|nr:hypothetical protein DSS3P22_gp03 [Ruegeria phage DSS3-P22]AWY08875.1 hypothetical protein vBRpoMiV15_03 [Ruegeria phage vB_RpoMi-V15]